MKIVKTPKEEVAYKMNFYEQQMQNLQQQLQAVDEGIVELANLSLNLDELKDSKEKEVLASVGRGIFIRAKIKSEDLLVDVGSKNFVKKDIEGTKMLIQDQIDKLEEVKKEIYNSLEELNNQISEIIQNAED
jgi:prefoldin alpha subunit